MANPDRRDFTIIRERNIHKEIKNLTGRELRPLMHLFGFMDVAEWRVTDTDMSTTIRGYKIPTVSDDFYTPIAMLKVMSHSDVRMMGKPDLFVSGLLTDTYGQNRVGVTGYNSITGALQTLALSVSSDEYPFPIQMSLPREFQPNRGYYTASDCTRYPVTEGNDGSESMTFWYGNSPHQYTDGRSLSKDYIYFAEGAIAMRENGVLNDMITLGMIEKTATREYWGEDRDILNNNAHLMAVQTSLTRPQMFPEPPNYELKRMWDGEAINPLFDPDSEVFTGIRTGTSELGNVVWIAQHPTDYALNAGNWRVEVPSFLRLA